jgi:hypothetical protein
VTGRMREKHLVGQATCLHESADRPRWMISAQHFALDGSIQPDCK